MTWTVFISGCLAVLALVNAWLIAKRRETFITDEKQTEQIRQLELSKAILETKLSSHEANLSSFSNRLNDFAEKINEVLGMKPLLEEVLLSIRELRRNQA